jgi:hypothetical protein
LGFGVGVNKAYKNKQDPGQSNSSAEDGGDNIFGLDCRYFLLGEGNRTASLSLASVDVNDGIDTSESCGSPFVGLLGLGVVFRRQESPPASGSLVFLEMSRWATLRKKA